MSMESLQRVLVYLIQKYLRNLTILALMEQICKKIVIIIVYIVHVINSNYNNIVYIKTDHLL